MNVDIGQLFTILAGLFVLIGVGYGAIKCKVTSTATTPILSTLLMRISLPCTIFVAMIRPYDPQFLTDGLTILAVSTAFTGLYILLTLVMMKPLHIPTPDRGAWAYCTVFYNAGFIGYPIALALFGDEGLSLSVILNVPLMLFCFSWGIYYIQKGSDNPNAPRADWKHVLFSECNMALVLSLVCYFNQWTPPDLLLTPASYLANLTTPLSLLIVGMNLAGATVKNPFKDKQILAATVIRLLILPGITCLILLVLPFENPMIPALSMILLATPSPASAAALCASNGGNETLASQLTFATSVLCMLTIPLWAMVF